MIIQQKFRRIFGTKKVSAVNNKEQVPVESYYSNIVADKEESGEAGSDFMLAS